MMDASYRRLPKMGVVGGWARTLQMAGGGGENDDGGIRFPDRPTFQRMPRTFHQPPFLG